MGSYDYARHSARDSCGGARKEPIMANPIAQICRACRGEGVTKRIFLCWGVDVDAASKALVSALVQHGEVQAVACECDACGGKGFKRAANDG